MMRLRSLLGRGFWVRSAAIVLAVAGLSLLAPGARAADVDPDAYRSLDVGDGLVTLDVQDALFGQVVTERIQPRTRVNIMVSPEAAEKRVTLKVVDLHWVQALDALVEKIGGVMVRKATNLLRVERPPEITFNFTDRPITEVIDALASVGGASVVISPRIDKATTVSLNLHDAPWRAALQRVVEVSGYALIEEDYGMILVVDRDQLEMEQDYYRFRYIRPPAPYKGVVASQKAKSAAGASGGINAGDVVEANVYVPSDDPKEMEENFPIIQALRNIVERDQGKVDYIPTENAIVFTGTKPRIAALKTLVSQLDVEPPQIFVDMNFIVTTNSDALDLGLSDAGRNGVGFRFGGADIVHMLPFNYGGSSSDLASAITGTPFPSPAAGAFSFGALNFSETDLLFKALQRDTSTKIVQAPKLLALDNQEATIFIGESIRYARTTAATNQNGGLTFAVEEDPNSPVNVGFQLLVIPQVIPEANKIRLLVIPQRRELTGSGPLEGFDRITVGGQSIDLPRVQSTTLKTEMILESGETAVIGGLLGDRSVERVDKIPLLGDIPLIGLAFQGKTSRCLKEHLLITITPRILRGSDAASCAISDELSGHASRVSAEWQDLSGDCAVNHMPPVPMPCDVPGATAPSTGGTPPPSVRSVPLAPGR